VASQAGTEAEERMTEQNTVEELQGRKTTNGATKIHPAEVETDTSISVFSSSEKRLKIALRTYFFQVL
jgi:hypothetical protein